MKILLFALLLAAAALAPAAAQTLPAGEYAGSAILGPVFLDGGYPLMVSESGVEFGRLELITSPTGALSGTYAPVGASPIPLTGQLTMRATSVKLMLKGTGVSGTRTQRVTLKATLAGAAFRGTLQIGRVTVPCAIDVAGIGQTKVNYRLSILSATNGKIYGTGTATVGRTQIAVVVTGSIVRGKGSLSMTGEKTFLRSATVSLETGGFRFAKWTSQGFGALLAGVNLPFAPVPPAN